MDRLEKLKLAVERLERTERRFYIDIFAELARLLTNPDFASCFAFTVIGKMISKKNNQLRVGNK